MSENTHARLPRSIANSGANSSANSIAVLLVSLGFLFIYFIFINSLPGVELAAGYTSRFSLWYLPLFVLGFGFVAAGFALGCPPVRTWLALKTGLPVLRVAASGAGVSRRFFERFLFINIYLTILLAVVVARLLIPYIDQHRTFNDTELYVVTAEIPLTDPAFWRAERSFTLPLVYKLLNVHTQNYEKRLALARVGDFQSAFSLLSWAILGLSLAAVLRSRWLRPLAFGLAAFLSLSLDLAQWDRIMLSESVSNSLFALWIAGWIWVVWAWERRDRARPWLLALIAGLLLLVTLLYAFTRDTNAYLALFFAGLLPAALLLRPLRGELSRSAAVRRAYLSLLAGSLLIFLLNSQTVDLGRRWQVPFYDILARRLLIDPQAREYFKVRGLRIDPEVQGLSALHPSDYQRALRSDPRFADVKAWIDANGRSAYMGYLLSRPLDSLRAPLADIREMVSPDPSIYRNPLVVTPRWELWLTRLLYPSSTILLLSVLGLLVALAGLLAVRGLLRPPWLVPLALLASTYPLMFLTWHGGTLELGRHSVQLALQLRLAGWMMLTFLADFIVVEYLRKKLG